MMATEFIDRRNLKEYAIDLIEVAYYNLLQTIYMVRPDVVYVQISPEVNCIAWIVGHLAAHMDGRLVWGCQGVSVLGKYGWIKGSPFITGSSKEEFHQGVGVTFPELVGALMQIGEMTFSSLREMPEEQFRKLPAKLKSKSKETLMTLIQRMSLHFLGHIGQIRVIRRVLGNPARGYFVTGLDKAYRKKIHQRFKDWWEASNTTFV